MHVPLIRSGPFKAWSQGKPFVEFGGGGRKGRNNFSFKVNFCTFFSQLPAWIIMRTILWLQLVKCEQNQVLNLLHHVFSCSYFNLSNFNGLKHDSELPRDYVVLRNSKFRSLNLAVALLPRCPAVGQVCVPDREAAFEFCYVETRSSWCPQELRSRTPYSRGDQRGALRGCLVVTERDSGGEKKDLDPRSPPRGCVWA